MYGLIALLEGRFGVGGRIVAHLDVPHGRNDALMPMSGKSASSVRTCERWTLHPVFWQVAPPPHWISPHRHWAAGRPVLRQKALAPVQPRVLAASDKVLNDAHPPVESAIDSGHKVENAHGVAGGEETHDMWQIGLGQPVVASLTFPRLAASATLSH